jgi:hypothetical protein
MNRYSEIKKATADVVNIRVVTKSSTAKAHAAIRDQSLSYGAIAELLGCSRWLVYTVAVEFGVKRARGGGSPARLKKQELEIKVRS